MRPDACYEKPWSGPLNTAPSSPNALFDFVRGKRLANDPMTCLTTILTAWQITALWIPWLREDASSLRCGQRMWPQLHKCEGTGTSQQVYRSIREISAYMRLSSTVVRADGIVFLSQVRDLFDRATAAKPCVLFFDEFDSIAPKRYLWLAPVTSRPKG